MRSSLPSSEGTLNRPARQASTGDERALQFLLSHLHVHVERYYASWLGASPEGAVLAQALTQEVLVRIGLDPEAALQDDAAALAHALRLAHGLAQELVR